MSLSFNILDEPFVYCQTTMGSRELGLRETLLQAPTILEIRDASPVVTIALHRLLLAILHRVFGPANGKAWKALWDARCFPAELLQQYFERWHNRFDLFDDKHPFFQDANFKAKQPGGINQLIRELARGNNATLFDHTSETPPPELPPAVVARSLIAEQVFAVGGGKSELGYTSSAPLIGGVAVLVLGDNLFQTLLLNLVRYPHEKTFATDLDEDAPAWERNARPTEGTQEPAGYLDYLTWQSRTIHLHPSSHGLIQQMSFAQGRKYAPKGHPFDPMVPYRQDEKEGDRPIRLQENRELWRDSIALFQLDPKGVFIRPRVLEWMKELMEMNYLERTKRYGLAVFGLCTDKAKINFWRHDTLPLPLDYLGNIVLVQNLEAALNLAEKVGQSLRYATADLARKMLAPGDMPPDKDRVWATVEAIAAERLYWSRLEVPFRQLLVQLPGDPDHQKMQIDAWFHEILYRTARAAFEESAGQLDNSARVLRAVVAGRRNLFISLAKIAKEANIQRPQPQGVTT